MVSDDQWRKIEPLLQVPRRKRKDGKTGRPPADDRACFEGILWVLKTGARWRDLPDRYPSGATCWRRLRQWEDSGALLDAWRKLLSLLDERGLLNWQETFMDGSFAAAKKGALESEPPSAGRVQSGWYWSMAKVFLWEHSWRLPRPTKSRSPKRRSRE
jgi:transposase